MSMLAERKQKQRWSLNPRGKHWSEDVNKFGHKMLEKMGWSAGKGLGANLDGITEHVKVSYKNDAKGMGFKDNGEQWTKHEDNFTSLLANLGAGSEAKEITLSKSEMSLEKKSQASKARVHYHKLTRGKDLTTRSEKDIANIFGRKTLERPAEPKEVKEEIVQNGAKDKSFGVVTVKAGNMTDYFKSKLSKIGNMSTSKRDYALNSRDDYESEIGACTGFGFASVTEKDTPSLGINSINFVSSQNEKTEQTPSLEMNEINFVSPQDKKTEQTTPETSKKRKRSDLEDWTEVVSKKKKKSKKKRMAFDNLGSDINPAEEVCYDNPCLKQTDSPREINNTDEKSKKKHVTFSSPIIEVLNKSDDSNKTEKSKKKKKKKPSTNGIDNLGCEENSFEGSNQLSNEENEKKRKKKKKPSIGDNENSVNVTLTKKKRKLEEVGIDNLACEEISVNEKNEEIKRYKLKKKAMEHGLVNPACVANDDSTQESSPKRKKVKSKENGLDNLGMKDIEVKIKKNKKQKNKNDTSLETSNDNISDVSQNGDELKMKKKKKMKKITAEENTISPSKKLKKKSKSKESGIENLGCEINTVEENIASINSEMDNYETELENEINVKKVTSKKSKNNTIHNNQQSTNDGNNFQKHSKFNEKPFGNRTSDQKIIDNNFENRNHGFGNRNNNFGNRNNNFGNRYNNFGNRNNDFGNWHNNFGNRNNDFGNWHNNFGNRNNDFGNWHNNFGNRNNDFGNRNNNFGNRNNDCGNWHNNFENRFDNRNSNFNNYQNRFNDQRGPYNFNSTVNDQWRPNNFNRPFNDQNSTWKPRFDPDRVDKTSLKAIIKPGALKLGFPGSNLMKFVGYGVTPEIINKKLRPGPEPEYEPSTETT